MRKEKSIVFLGLLVSLLAASPFVWACFYVYPQNDDFAYANWESFLKFQKEIYQNVGGRFSCSVIASLSPLHWKSFFGYQLFLAVTLIMFCTTAFYVSKEVFSRFLFNSNLHSVVVSVLFVILCLSGMPMLKEAFFWHSGTAAYSMPFIFFFWALGLLVRWYNKWHRWQMFLIAAFTFLCIGGNELYLLAIWSLIGISLICFWRHAKAKLYNWAPLFIAVAIATTLVLAAPGNSVRVSNEMTADFSMSQGIQLAFVAYLQTVKSVLSNQAFWLIVVFTGYLVLSNQTNKVFSKSKLAALVMANMVMVFLCLPAAAIYQAMPVARYMNVIFWLTAILMIANLWTLLVIGSRILYSKSRFFVAYHRIVAGLFVTIGMLLFFHYAPWQFNNYSQLYQDVQTGKLESFKREWEIRIRIANGSKTDTLMLPEIDAKPHIVFLFDLDTLGGKKYLINSSMARFWGKKAVLPLSSTGANKP